MQELSYNLSPPLACSHLKVTVLYLWYHQLSLQKGSESQSAAGIWGGGDKGLQDKSILFFLFFFPPDKLWAVGEHRKGGRMKGMDESTGLQPQAGSRDISNRSSRLNADLYPTSLLHPTWSLPPISPFWATSHSENASPGWPPLPCQPQSKVLCNGPLKCSLQDAGRSICTCDGSPRRGEVKIPASCH